MGSIFKQNLQNFLGITIHQGTVDFETIDTHETNHYQRHLIKYLGNEGDEIRAFLFIPKSNVIGSVLVHHQHHGERHLGKSEVAGILGDPYQFFCMALAKQGIICLAPDSICFEDRRTNKNGTEPDNTLIMIGCNTIMKCVTACLMDRLLCEKSLKIPLSE